MLLDIRIDNGDCLLTQLCLCLQAYLLPKFKSWVRSVLAEESETDKKVSPPSPAPSAEPPVNEAALAANAAAAAASEVAAAMREFSQSRVKGKLRPLLALIYSASWVLHRFHILLPFFVRFHDGCS